MRKIAAIYTRVSTDGQETTVAPKAQADVCKDLATQKGFTETRLFDADAITSTPGTILERPGMNELLQFLENNPDVKDVFTYHVNRIGRNLTVISTLVEKINNLGVTIHTHADRLEINKSTMNFNTMISLVMSADDYNQTIKRFAVTKAAAKKQGKPVNGATPRGYKRINEGTIRDKKTKFVIDPDEKEFIKLVLTEYLKPKTTMTSVLNLANNLGNRRNGKLLSRGNIYSVLQHAFTFAGEYYQDVTVPKSTRKNGHTQVQRKPMSDILEMILSKMSVPFTNIEPYITFDEAKTIYEKVIHNHKHLKGRKPIVEALFRGMVYCGKCGGKAATTRSIKPDNKEYFYYACTCRKIGLQNPNNYVPCEGFSVIRTQIYDEKIFEKIIDSFSATDLSKIIKLHTPEIDLRAFKQYKALERELEQLKIRLEGFQSDYNRGLADGNQLKTATDFNKKEYDRIVSVMRELKPQVDKTSQETADINYLASNADKIINGLRTAKSFQDKRQLLEDLHTRLYVTGKDIIVKVRGISLSEPN